MKFRAATVVLLLIAANIVAQDLPQHGSVDRNRPPSVFVSKNACPFECCTYREWIARSELRLRDRPDGRVTGIVHKGEHVQGVTGVVITHPLPFQISKQEEGIPAGATAYLLHPTGEGYWQVWYRGKVVNVEADSYPHGTPDYRWWALVNAADGRSGWVDMRYPSVRLPFYNVDACG